ncbi:MAG: ATP-grasp domain-containing protein [Deltaproteobacteria bacterium]|nr:ATP-grasp domain-containing protein [Deltaproteobacteria bacterium]
MILLVGYRREALRAALGLGYQVILWNDASIPKFQEKKITKKILHPFQDIRKVPSKLIPLLKKYHIQFVSGVTEKSVLPAASVREFLGLPGPRFKVAKLCRDKTAMKTYAKKKKIRVTPFVVLKKNIPLKEIEKRLSYPVVLKKKALYGRRGLKIVKQPSQLKKALKSMHLAEKMIRGKEFSIESFIHQGKILFRNPTEYYELYTINFVPAFLSPKKLKALHDFNDDIIKKFGIRDGVTHLECYWTKDGILFGEIALRPPGGYIMNLIKIAYGFDPWKAFFEIEAGNKPHLSRRPKKVAASWIVHPGEGRVRKVVGLKHLQKIALDAKINLKPGQIISKRMGTGENVGRILLESTSRKRLMKDINKIRENFRIEMDSW